MFISKYSCVLDVAGKQYILNTYNSALIELDRSACQKIRKAQHNDAENLFTQEELELLSSEGFLVDSSEELHREHLVKMGYHASKYSSAKTLKIDIGITDKCNFTCPYCFENGNKNTDRFRVSKYTYTELFSDIRQYIIDHIGSDTKEVEIVWYGGEPSLEYEFICFVNKKIIEDSFKYGFHFSNTIITNGYSVAEDYVDKLSKQNVKYMQVTLDGLRETHNSRRNTAPKVNSFEIILNNIELLLQKGIEVVIRINIDASNAHEISSLLDYLAGRFSEDAIGQLLFVSFGRVFGSKQSLGHMEYEAIYHDLYLKACALGFIDPGFEDSEVGAFCGAETMNSDIVIDFMGNKYKCWNDIFDPSLSVGNIRVGSSNAREERELSTELLYMEQLSLDHMNAGRCLSCEYIKYCGGLCPFNRKMLLEGTEENIFENHICKDIVRRRIETHIEAYLYSHGILSNETQ